ncbi:hypothetical protein CU254_09520 [Amycolatopsis sp. AA4]|nr:hypothetical protein CU254_09520 [Amycolatopsis sp. AA4]EFL06191.1 predicted protein [Streptomyces sp. AA4]
MRGQTSGWAQHEFVQDAAGGWVPGQAEDAAFKVGEADGEAGQGAGVVVGTYAYSPGVDLGAAFVGVLGVLRGASVREVRWLIGAGVGEGAAGRRGHVHGTYRSRRT